MATTQEDVNKLIESMVQEKTLSLDAMVSIQALKDRVAKADIEIEQYKGVIKARDASIAGLQADNARLKEQIAPLADRELKVAEREAKMNQLELQAAVARAEAGAFRHSLGVVFASNTVRESVLRTRSHSEYDSRTGQSNSSSENDNVTTTKTEGYSHPEHGDRNNLG
jgi:hypothetical protein